MAFSGKGVHTIYLVYGPQYELVGLAFGERQARQLGDLSGGAFKVVGPVVPSELIDWETVGEEVYGQDYGPVKDWVDLNDGVPYVEPPLPVSYEEARAIPSHARGH